MIFEKNFIIFSNVFIIKMIYKLVTKLNQSFNQL